jgi:putative phosphoribosyl transferase
MAEIHIQNRVGYPHPVFSDRCDAGIRLAAYMHLKPEANSVVFGLPRGGISVGAPISQALHVPLVPVIVRKLPIPYSPEMGFGAVALDGSVVLNPEVVSAFRISESEIETIIRQVLQELERRQGEYAAREAPHDIKDKQVYLVDDGLATGYSVLAALAMIRNQEPDAITLCVPVSSEDAIRKVAPSCDQIYCLIVQTSVPFAVASYYRDFRDLTDDEVRNILQDKQYSKP